MVYSFAPGPTVDTQPVPPLPPDTHLDQVQGESLVLSDGAIVFQGSLTNNDSFWWAADIKVELTLRDARGVVVWELETPPDDEELEPGEVTGYEIRVPADAPFWETSQIDTTRTWSCQ